MYQTIQQFRLSLPEAINHWNIEDIVGLRSVEFRLEPADAREFVAGYVATKRSEEYRYLGDGVAIGAD